MEMGKHVNERGTGEFKTFLSSFQTFRSLPTFFDPFTHFPGYIYAP